MINPMSGFMPPDVMFMQMMRENESAQDDRPLAMAFINRQTELDLMDTEQGYNSGTIFNGLNKPFMPEGDRR